MVTSKVLYKICKHSKLKSLVTSLALQQLGEVDTVTKQERVSVLHDIEVQWYTICMLIISILGIVTVIILNTRKLKLFRGHFSSNTVKIMLFISGAECYVPAKLCRTAGSIHLLKITGTLLCEHLKLKRNILSKRWCWWSSG